MEFFKPMKAHPMQVLIIASWLPKLSETFVYRDVLGLRQAGVTVGTASVHRPQATWDDPVLTELAVETIPVYGAGPLRLLRDAAAACWRRPRQALATLSLIVRDGLRGSDVRGIRRLKVFWQGLAGLALARRLASHPPQHIHAHMAHVPATIAMYAARQLGVPFSFTGHAADIFRDRSLLTEKLARADFVRCISVWHRRFYNRIVSRAESRYPVIRCGVDINAFTVADPPPADPPPLIMSVGRLVPKKGMDLLLRALSRLQQAGHTFRGLIIGEGPELPRLTALVQQLGLAEQVELAGARPNSIIRQLLPAATIFALPCRTSPDGDQDGIPVVLMEAMACQVACISGDLPAIRELITDQVSGILIPPENVDALTRGLMQLLADHQQRHQLAEQASRRIAEEFALTINVERLQQAIKRVS